jgi:hypothetical protein
VKVDPSKKPKTADWQITTEGDLKGKTALGIYDVDENTFKHCFALEKRPEKFESEEGSTGVRRGSAARRPDSGHVQARNVPHARSIIRDGDRVQAAQRVACKTRVDR